MQIDAESEDVTGKFRCMSTKLLSFHRNLPRAMELSAESPERRREEFHRKNKHIHMISQLENENINEKKIEIKV